MTGNQIKLQSHVKKTCFQNNCIHKCCKIHEDEAVAREEKIYSPEFNVDANRFPAAVWCRFDAEVNDLDVLGQPQRTDLQGVNQA